MSLVTEIVEAIHVRRRDYMMQKGKDCTISVYLNPEAYMDLRDDPAVEVWMNAPISDQVVGCPIYAVNRMSHPRWVIHIEE